MYDFVFFVNKTPSPIFKPFCKFKAEQGSVQKTKSDHLEMMMMILYHQRNKAETAFFVIKRKRFDSKISHSNDMKS